MKHFGILFFIGIATMFVASLVYEVRSQDLAIEVKESRFLHAREDSKWLVYTDVGVFENTESLVYGKLHVDDFRKTLAPGKKFLVTVQGYDVPWFGIQRNIVKIKQTF